MDVFDVIRTDPRLKDLAARLASERGMAVAGGLWGSAAPILAAMCAERLGRPLLLVTAHLDEADEARDDIETALGRAPELLPQPENLPGEAGGASDEIAAERLRLCLELLRRRDAGKEGRGDEATEGRSGEAKSERDAQASGRTSDASNVTITTQSAIRDPQSDSPLIIVAPVQALMHPVPSPEAVREQSFEVSAGQRLDPERLSEWLVEHGFERSDAVELPGDFARRGGILDIFSNGAVDPIRIEFFGDEVESIRFFDVATQRSTSPLGALQIPAMKWEEGNEATRQRGSEDANGGTRGPRDRGWETTGFLAYLPSNAIVAFNEPVEIQEIGRTYQQRLGERVGVVPVEAVFRRAAGFSQLHLQRFAAYEDGPQTSSEDGPQTPSSASRLTGRQTGASAVQRGAGAKQTRASAVQFDVSSLPPFDQKAVEAIAGLAALAAEADVTVLCDNRAEEQRFEEMLGQLERRPASLRTQVGVIHHGFVWRASEPRTEVRGLPETESEPRTEVRGLPEMESEPPIVRGLPKRTANGARRSGSQVEPATIPAADSEPSPNAVSEAAAGPPLPRGVPTARPHYVVPHHELFHRYRQRRTLRRVQPARPIDSFFDLSAGDHVVHIQHGIGRFLGLKTLDKETRSSDGEVSEQRAEYLAIEYADKAVVHVPISQIHLVQKYIGGFKGKPTLSKIGGTAWKRTKERVADAVTDMAGELLAIQARRATEPGLAYPHDTLWQKEFEGSFLYTETPDQVRALDEIKGDQTRPRPMDRLLCGDVGYGKTELAIRAAFKVVEFGKQVAVLVPTTVLAEQHFLTFRERMADYPFTIEVLSRFRSTAEQKKIIERTRQGQIDILIGTHRLLSNDVKFADLGLVVIDEEQRFGVEAKERLKKLRATVDVLTLSATPIPRTLHLSMLGIRDISSLATAPVDRRAIITQVRMWDDQLLREAIVRELNRDGQAYVVHNFVRDIDEIANKVRTLVPEARVVVGHGQMSGPELEDVMLKFLNREADVLVSTNIIESGIDIASANTILINRAERFGLADLHQLRGRVGRSKHRAYCYLLLSPKHPVQEVAARRLKAIEQYSDLGAGFQIAMRDLEIRGAGNILGAEQSGHIEAVGYEMYCQLLEEAVRRMKNEPGQPFRMVNLDLGITAAIPRAYIRADRQRMEVYKRLTTCRTPQDITTLADDLRDAFGPPPPEVLLLLTLAEIRVLSQKWGIRSIVRDPPDVIFAVDDIRAVEPLFASGPGSPRAPDNKTVHWRLPKKLLEPPALLNVVRNQLATGDRSPAPAIRE